LLSTDKIVTRSQLVDYSERGDELEALSVLRFFVDTYEAPVAKDAEEASTLGKRKEMESEVELSNGRGRPRHGRVSYRQTHPLSLTKERVLRQDGHNVLPNFVGAYFPRNDNEDVREFYSASMLVLFKPWRCISDLKRTDQSWEDAFREFRTTAPPYVAFVLSNIQYFHRCETAAEEDRAEASNPRRSSLDDDLQDEGEDAEIQAGFDRRPIVASDVEYAWAARLPEGELAHGQAAVDIAKRSKIFTEGGWEAGNSSVSRFTVSDSSNLVQWQQTLAQDGLQQRQDHVPLEDDLSDIGEVEQMEDALQHLDMTADVVDWRRAELALTAVDPTDLFVDQRRAYDIVEAHFRAHLAGEKPRQLLMQILGEGGTGKSKVIQTVTKLFEEKGFSHMLIKGAFTGIAASLIDGKTTHKIGLVSTRGVDSVSAKTRTQLSELLGRRDYLIIDEISMISAVFLARLSRRIAIGKASAQDASSKIFGGMNVIICGDFHQFPPVAGGSGSALYYRSGKTDEHAAGRMIYEAFSTVVILGEQVRVKDAVWMEFLRRLRVGEVGVEDIKMLEALVIQPNATSQIDFRTSPWNDACLITPRHGVRVAWNQAATREHCRATGHVLFVCPAEDRINGRPLTLAEEYAMAKKPTGPGSSQRGGSHERAGLPNFIEIAIGMKVMVTFNIDTDLDLANGSRGVITDIKLDTDEPELVCNEGMVRLRGPPAYILVRLNRTKASRLSGLDENVIPIIPTERSFQITIRGTEPIRKTVKRRQYPLTAAYAFTDYRSQGQTIPYVIVDISRPPSGSLTLFNIYVALSRSSGRETIRLLRGFDLQALTMPLDLALAAEDKRLHALNESTRKDWAEVQVVRHGELEDM
jgi:hypothetical protein